MTTSSHHPMPTTPSILLQSRHTRVAMGILAGSALLLVSVGSMAIYLAICPGGSFAIRALLFALGATALSLPTWAMAVLLHRRWTTGQWSLTPEQRARRFSKLAARGTPRWLGSLNIATTAVSFLLAAVMLRSAILKPSDGWFYASTAVVTASAVLSAWQFFRTPGSPRRF